MSNLAKATPWNPELTLERLGGDRELFREMMQIFLEEAPKQIEAIRGAMNSGNRKEAEHAAHRLKGDLGYLDAPDAVECARELEDAGHHGELAGAAAAFSMLEANVQAISSVMRSICTAR